MKSKQQGLTAISFIVIALFVGLFAMALLKITPFYLEQMKVETILEDVENDFSGKGASARDVKAAIQRRLGIEMVYDVKIDNFNVKKSSKGLTVHAKYERRAQYLGNLYLVTDFDRKLEIPR